MTPESMAFGGQLIIGDKMKKELIKQRDVLITGGTGVCLFGLWSIIRIVMAFIMDSPEKRYYLGRYDSFGGQLFEGAVFVFVIVLVLAAHIYIGMSSRAAGYRPTKRKVPVVVTILFIVLCSFSMWSDIFEFDFNNKGYIAYIVTLGMDLTLIITLIGIVIAWFRIRWLQKHMTDGGYE